MSKIAMKADRLFEEDEDRLLFDRSVKLTGERAIRHRLMR